MSDWRDKFSEKLQVFEFQTTLPGTGKSIKYKPLTTAAIKKISAAEGADLATIDTILDDIIKDCVIGNIDTNNLYLADKLFLLFQIRKASRGKEIQLPIYKCPKCKGQSPQKINLSDVNVIPYKKGDPIVKLTNDIYVEIDHLKRIDQIVGHEYAIKMNDNIKIDSMFATVASSIKKLIISGEENTDLSMDDKMFIMTRLPEEALEKLNNWHKENKFGLDEIKIDKKCPHCGNVENITVEIENLIR